MARFLILLGVVLVLVGLAMTAGFKFPSWLGRLPGDLIVRKENFSFYFPITTCILISGISTLLFYIFRR